MPPFDAAKHPRCILEFRFEDGAGDSAHRGELIRVLGRLTAAKVWSIGPPELVDEMDDDVQGDDQPIVTLGGALELYSGYREDNLPADIDRQQLDEVEFLMTVVKDLSRRTGTTIMFEWNGDPCGQIERGELDSSLQIGFLDEWRKGLDQKG